MQFSVVVPVYNVERYLNDCLQSILNQNYTDFEVILIDDGSTDQSGAICDEWGEKNNNVHVIHTENKGLSCARNTGIRMAKGDYLVFVDSDDWIEKNSLKGFDEIIEKTHPEIIETRLIEEYGDRTVIKDQHYSNYLQQEFTRERALNWILYETDDTWPAPKRICKRLFIIENDLFFADGRLQEDIDWTTRLCCCAMLFAGCAQPWYHYRMKREGSITNNIHAKYITDVIEMAAIDRRMCESNDVYTKKAFNTMMCSVYIAINLYKYCSKEDQQIVSLCIKRNMWIFEYMPSMKYRIFAYMVKCIGVEKSLKLLSHLG